MSKIYVSTWGYEQTNVDFYQVVKESEKSLWVREISSRVVTTLTSMSEKVLPCEDDFVGDIFMCRKTPYGIRVKYGQHADLWDGRPVYSSSYY